MTILADTTVYKNGPALNQVDVNKLYDEGTGKTKRIRCLRASRKLELMHSVYLWFIDMISFKELITRLETAKKEARKLPYRDF